jgi:hypothetical protein
MRCAAEVIDPLEYAMATDGYRPNVGQDRAAQPIAEAEIIQQGHELRTAMQVRVLTLAGATLLKLSESCRYHPTVNEWAARLSSGASARSIFP